MVFVSLSRSFVDMHRKGLVHVGITLEFLLTSAKLDMRKNGLENGIATPRRNCPVSIAERKFCECFYYTPITIPTCTMCNIVDNICYMYDCFGSI